MPYIEHNFGCLDDDRVRRDLEAALHHLRDALGHRGVAGLDARLAETGHTMHYGVYRGIHPAVSLRLTGPSREGRPSASRVDYYVSADSLAEAAEVLLGLVLRTKLPFPW